MNAEMIEYAAGAVVGVVVIVVMVNLLTLPFQLLFKLIINSVVGAIMLYIINLIGLITIKITFIHCFIAGTFGVPGVIGLMIYTYAFKN